MLIQKKRIRNIEPHLIGFKSGQSLYVGKQIADCDKAILKKYGFNPDDALSQTHEPSPLKRQTTVNVDGDWIVHTDQPKEPRTFDRAYHVIDWHGTDHYGICYVTRDCYPRTYIEPRLVELTLYNNILRSPIHSNDPNQYEALVFTVNIFLEMFGSCEILDENLVSVAPPSKLRKVSWTLLPVGKMPWDKGKERLKDVFQKAQPNKRGVIGERHHAIWAHEPESVAIGTEGFSGYVVYCFPAKDLYVFESNRYNNATYIFRGKWEEFSQLTKRDILQGNFTRGQNNTCGLMEKRTKQTVRILDSIPH